MRWSYDPEVDAANIDLTDEAEWPIRTIDLEGAHVLLDVDGSGQVVSIEILGPARDVRLKDLAHYLQREAE